MTAGLDVPVDASGTQTPSVWRGFLSRGPLMVVGKIAAFATTILVARSLSLEDAGTFFFVLSLSAFASLILTFGLQEAVPRVAAERDAVGDRTADAVPVQALLLQTALALLLGAVAYAVEAATSHFAGGVLLITVVLGFCISIGLVAASFLRTRGHTWLAEVGPGLVPVLFFGSSLLLFSIMEDPSALAALGLRVVIEGAIALIVVFVVLKKTGITGGSFRETAPLARMAAPLWTTGLAWFGIQQADLLILGLMKSDAHVGVYAPLLKVGELALLAAFVFSPYLLPAVVRIHAAGGSREVQRLYTTVSKFAYALVAPVLTLLVVAPDAVMETLFGISAASVAVTARLLAAGYWINAIFGLNGACLEALGKVGSIARRSLSVFLIAVVANVVLIPTLGLEGAALSSLVAYLALNIASSWMLYAETRVSPFKAELLVTVGVSLAALATVMAVSPEQPGIGFLIGSAIVVGAAGLVAALLTTEAAQRRKLLSLLVRKDA